MTKRKNAKKLDGEKNMEECKKDDRMSTQNSLEKQTTIVRKQKRKHKKTCGLIGVS